MKKLFSTLKLPKLDSRGDTIVEILIAMAILALVLGTAYAVSSSSLRTGTAAGQRSQALGYAQSQVEFIKDAQLSDPANLTQYTSAPCVITDDLDNPTPPCQNFCVAASGDGSPNFINNPPAGDDQSCIDYDNNGYTVKVRYLEAFKTFQINLSWSGANLTAEESRLALYYKLPGGFPLSPTVVTLEATGVAQDRMVLNGTVNPNGTDVTSCYFKFGTSSSPDTSGYNLPDIPCAQTMPITSEQSISALRTGLSASTTYYFRACAVNDAGTVCGEEKSATTLAPSQPPPPPVPPSGGGNCMGQSNDGTVWAGPDPCVHYLRAIRTGANSLRLEFRADHCTVALGGSYPNDSWGASTRDGNGADPETVNVGNVTSSAGSVSIMCIGKGGHYWSGGSANFAAWGSPSPPPPPCSGCSPPPPQPPPTSPIVSEHWHENPNGCGPDWPSYTRSVHYDYYPYGNFQGGEDRHDLTGPTMC
jgi:type II secretory pathway pseudopilin PulG